jgi:preprotein translocase subunit SecA
MNAAKQTHMGADVMRQFEKAVMLQTLDTCWREHLAAMDYLRQGIHLRGYAQKNPKQEYKRESFEMFSQLLDKVNYEVISALSKFEVRMEQDLSQMQAQQRQTIDQQHVQYKHAEVSVLADETAAERVEEQPGVVTPITRNSPKIGRNDPCTCGSGKKYKQCHGKLD